jgi:hypothetical protein
MKWVAVLAAFVMALGAPYVEHRTAVLGLAAGAFLCLACTRPRLRFDAPTPARRA